METQISIATPRRRSNVNTFPQIFFLLIKCLIEQNHCHYSIIWFHQHFKGIHGSYIGAAMARVIIFSNQLSMNVFICAVHTHEFQKLFASIKWLFKSLQRSRLLLCEYFWIFWTIYWDGFLLNYELRWLSPSRNGIENSWINFLLSKVSGAD